MVRKSASKSTWPSRAGEVVFASLFLCSIVSEQTPKPASADTKKRLAQVHLGDSHASVPRSEKELKSFAKVNLPRARQNK